MPNTTPKRAAIAALSLALGACSAEPIVIQNSGRTIELTGGPANISNTAEAIDYHQPTADRLCREKGYPSARSAGQQTDAFITSYIFRCEEA